jgi:bacteriocin-like protein
MRELTATEMNQVSGGTGVCTPGNSIAGVSDFNSVGNDIIAFYEGLVFATSHIIERVAKSFS